MATDSLYGLDNFSYLSPAQQDTAKTIRDAFANSEAQKVRQMNRYPGLIPPSAPMVSEMFNDQALKRAQVTAGIINNNQQLQNVIDASHATPHGIMQNLAAYLPSAAAALRAFPALFGQGEGSALSRQGLIPYAANKISHWFKSPDGATYGLDDSGKVVATYPAGYSGYPDLGISDASSGQWSPAAGSGGNQYANFQDMWPPVTPDTSTNFGETQWPDTSFGTPDFDIPYGM